jgi:N-acetylglucosaminyl-diphospho-decaprenol L-rhamnosyltransferase
VSRVGGPLPAVIVPADARVGVVVLTHNRAREVVCTLEHLRALPERPPIVVVDNASTDGTTDIVRRRFPDLTCLRLTTNTGAAGRNAGVRCCDRPYVALCDDDTWWAPGALQHAADLLDAHPRLAVVTARVLVREKERVDPVSLEMARSPLPAPPGLPGAPLLGFLAGASVVRRSAFLQVGGFEPRLFLGGEEQLLAIDLARAGWALAYVDCLIVHHYPSPQRDIQARVRLLERNALWVAWLRRPPHRALTMTARLARRSLHGRAARAAFQAALPGLPWALRHRQVVPAALERQLRLIDKD